MPEEEQATEPKTEQPETTEEQAPEIKYTATIEEAGPCKKKVSIEVQEETIKSATDEQYESLRKEALVPGFRKGRAPRRLLEKRFGKEATEQVKLKLLADASAAAIKDNELDSLGEPDIDFEKIELPETGPLKFDFEIEVRPQFDLPPLEGIPVTKTKLEVTDELTDREIQRIRKWSGLWTPREGGAVELEDQIIADVILKPVPGAAEGAEGVDSASSPQIEEEQKLNNTEIYVRKNGFVGAIPVEKLDELLVGAKAGDVKQTTIEVPKTYFKEEFRGKKVDIQITIKDIKWLKPAELDENFLKRYEVKDEAELREKIHDILHGQLEQKGRSEMTEQIYQYLLDNTNFDLPVDIVAEHSATLLKRQYVNLLMRGLPRQQVDEQMEQLRASSEEKAKQQFKVFFIIDKIAEKLGIEVNEEEINGQIAQLAMQQGRRPERMREEMERDGSLAQLKLQVHEKKCIDKLLESAAVTESAAGGEKKAAKKAAAKQKSKSAKKPAKEKGK
jgi:trigger factor